MWKFIKRQLSTKTGRAALGMLVGWVAQVVPVVGPLIGTYVPDLITDAVNATAGTSLLAMYLRDGEAKKQGK